MERAYFQRYCGEGDYDEVYPFYSGVDHCIALAERMGLARGRVLVLGAATGRVLEHFEAAWGVRPRGCELSRWAHAQIPARHRRQIARADMRHDVPRRVGRGERYDLVFTNALVYLEARDLTPLVRGLAELRGHLHFWSSTSEDHAAHDPWRVTLRPRAWWRRLFTANGFEPTRSRYLWRPSARG